MLLRTTQRPRTDGTQPLHENYVYLVRAIFLCALRDLRHAKYADEAQRWLHSEEAAWYASLLGVDVERMRRLIESEQDNGRKQTFSSRRAARMQAGATHRDS
jgi:hypothetical protein